MLADRSRLQLEEGFYHWGVSGGKPTPPRCSFVTEDARLPRFRYLFKHEAKTLSRHYRCQPIPAEGFTRTCTERPSRQDLVCWVGEGMKSFSRHVKLGRCLFFHSVGPTHIMSILWNTVLSQRRPSLMWGGFRRRSLGYYFKTAASPRTRTAIIATKNRTRWTLQRKKKQAVSHHRCCPLFPPHPRR